MFQCPEIANEDNIQEDHQWFQMELWALGIIMYYMAVGSYPFDMDISYLDLLDCISNLDFDKRKVCTSLSLSLVRLHFVDRERGDEGSYL